MKNQIRKDEIIDIEVRSISMRLTGGNRSLVLCARMNYETENLDFIDTLDKDTDVLFDLGACEGRFSVYSGLKGIRTICFEPEKMNFEVLRQNLTINNLTSTVIPFNMGISDKEDNGVMHIGQPWAGGHQKIVQHAAVRDDVATFDRQAVQEVMLTSLDNFLNSHPEIPTPTHLKVDIDGSEWPFVQGASATLANPSLKGILIELEEGDASSDKTHNALLKHGFALEDRFQIPNEPRLFNFLFVRS